MAVLTINDNPTITDTIVFNLPTPDAQGCFLSNPYMVNKVVIYFVERDFTSGNLSTYNDETYDVTKIQNAINAEAIACADPTSNNIAVAKQLRAEADNSIVTTPFYFNQAVPVQIVGDSEYPAWLSTDLNNAFLTLISTGEFTYTWQPEGMREGDYFICWTWTPLIAGGTLSSHARFYLIGNTQITTSIPTHQTDPTKYPTLLDRYTPDMYKMMISNDDRTPDVVNKLNNAIALGFNDLENLANQIVDLQDANSIPEALIPYLSNFFNLQLRTNDPTRWRGQIKRAIPLYKMKGTRAGVIEAMQHAAINVLSINQLWEVISSYTWQEVFTFDGQNESFELEKVALPLDYENFALYLRAYNSNNWVYLSSDYVDFITLNGLTTMNWVGNTLSVDAIDLVEGDEIRVLYLYNYVTNGTVQTIENYVRGLPLMDQRDERSQLYPLKNWNVRVIANTDPMFDLIVSNRNPYNEFLVYGKVRTEFPYGENIYNMDEYNGSTRNSKVPCDIDKNFIDPCTACISSAYNIDLEIENISDDRIKEAKEVLTEHMPFHAVLHTFNFVAGINEFVEPPIEEIEMLVSFNGNEFVIAGEAQTYFNRIMKFVNTNGILRSELATKTTALSTTEGIAYNDRIVMFCPNQNFNGLGISDNCNLDILAPSPLAGTYSISGTDGNALELTVVPGSEPIANCNSIWNDQMINTCAFTFDVNDVVPYISGNLCNIAQDNLFIFSDLEQNFGLLGVQSTFDVDEGTATSAYTISISVYGSNCVILDINPDGSLTLLNDGTLPSSNTSGISYQIFNGSSVVSTSVTGNLTVIKRGNVTVLNSDLFPVNAIIGIENHFFIYGGVEYPIVDFVPNTNNNFYIQNYASGNNNSVTMQINKKLVSQKIGYLSYRGLKLQMPGNLESSLGIQNGANSLVSVDQRIENNKFKENFIINIGSDNYFIADINGNSPSGYTTITLSGNQQYWKTLNSGGTSVNVTIYNYAKEGATIIGQQFDLPTHTFPTLDRSGRSVINRTDETGFVTGLSLPKENEISEVVRQQESISFCIEYKDGTKEEGTL